MSKATWMAALLLAIAFSGAALAGDSAIRTRSLADEGWRPFALNWKAQEPPVWDFSFADDAPAGKDGAVRAVGSHFEIGGSGRRLRLWGANISGPACFPSAEEAKQAASFLRRWGFNAVRLSHADASWANGLVDYSIKERLAFNEDKMDRLQRFLAELKAAGIYYVIDGRHDFEFATSEFNYLDSFWRRRGCSFLLCFSSAMRRCHEQYLRTLFLAKNPYTGLSLAEDPALAGVQMLNESFLGKYLDLVKSQEDLPAPLRQEFAERWTQWSRGNGIQDAYDGKLDLSIRRRFLSWLERDSFRSLYAFYREELGVKCPLATTSCYVGAFTLPSAYEGDYSEGHAYYSHPRAEEIDTPAGKLKLSRLEPEPAYVGGNYMKWLPFAISQRAGYQPFIVGEWNDCVPEAFDAPLMAAVFGDIQDIDGCFLFTLAQSPWSQIETRNCESFISLGKASIMLNMIPAALAWRGAMLPVAEKALAVEIPEDLVFGKTASRDPKKMAQDGFGGVADAEGKLVNDASGNFSYKVFADRIFLFRLYNCPEAKGAKTPPQDVARVILGEAPSKALERETAAASERCPIRIQNGLATVVAPKWVALWGRFDGPGTRAAGPLEATPAGAQDFSVSAASLDSLPLADSRRVLVTIGSVSVAKNDSFRENVELKTGKVLERWLAAKGGNCALVKPVRAKISFTAGSNWRCFAVSDSGVRGALLASSQGNGISWDLQDSQAFFFLLER